MSIYGVVQCDEVSGTLAPNRDIGKRSGGLLGSCPSAHPAQHSVPASI